MAVRIRKDVWKFTTWDPILEWYAKAIVEMQSRPIADPTSWRYQAAIHDFTAGTDPANQLPSAADQTRFWRQCQHFCWFFLPWHRMYLLYFERIVAAAVVKLGGPPGWALPYWNYSDATNPDARRLPQAFRELKMPDGSDNPLHISDRDAGNDGNEVGDAADVDVCPAVRKRRFVAQALGGDPGFGGGQSGFNHGRGFATIAGELERVPHGSIHVAVGGFMGAFDTAGLDPLFWLHHANIDRLWEVWRQSDPSHTDPTQALWRTGVSFPFHNELGQIVTHTSSQMVSTTTAPLDYEYEEVSDPCASPFERAPGTEADMSERRPEMVGATHRPVELGGEPTVARLSITSPTGPAQTDLESNVSPEVYLNIENITGTGRPTSYAVYLNVPEGNDPEQHPELFAGILPMFGVAEASQTDANHAGSGLQYTLDVTPVVRHLETHQAWDPDDVRISFVPRRKTALESARAVAAPIRIGRVSVYFA